MSAILKIYTDSGHTSEVAHTAYVNTTLSGNTSIGATSITVASTTNMPTQGYIDIDTGGSLETVPYASISGTTINLAKALVNAHSGGATVVQWYYFLAIGDQANGILNDGTNATPNGNNTATWYLYNAGDQTAQSIVLSTSNVSPSTPDGYADTLISITGSSSGFATSVTPSNLVAGATQQFWLVAEIPNGQALSGSANPQICLININAQSL